MIQSVTNWYAYNSQEVFLDRDGGAFTINLGATQADVDPLAAGINDLQELSKTHETISKAKTQT